MRVMELSKIVTEADVAKLQEDLKQLCEELCPGDGCCSSTSRNVLCTLGTLWTVVITWFRMISH